ncbi:3-hydroxyisobutyrate dehydrogenase [Acholeplasma laidlawii]|uniref:3-hydroxyisobutyrate dehydrogenase n=2 Tax=Acholeplasma laidlawii TaxID=2148 RepID=A9NEC8_ACHLI|nr:3-hydroxyisobutyrate dehydrogenase [Acholeplasma laidlawii PG-8A]OAN19427.1 oxidoreductase [Acholeplasma laidlawii]OED27680.1 oxidoreductase [Acholeplasma laidlawii]OED29250.1 oxidoreductase [Acholeplasma laidlawii]OWU87722.1 oxidoreductase [Acholeplasma laidlawii]
MNIGLIGTGIMGSPIVRHLAEGGHTLTVYNRTKEKAEKLSDVAYVASTIEELTQKSDIIFMIVGYPKDVETVALEIFKTAKLNTIIVDMTTSSPSLAAYLYDMAKEKGLHMMDAPVTGGEVGAIAGTLSIMVGGDETNFDIISPLLETFGKTIQYMGKAGNGQRTKLANQIAIAGALAGTVESLYYANSLNLDLTKAFEIFMGGSASSTQMKTNGLHMINKYYEPGFYIKHFLKDLNLAIESSVKHLEVTVKVRDMLEVLVDNHHENKGTQALILYYLDNLAIL